jgi:phosphotransferase system  glucose/maltose/N-acetylglucosamine-specific IIC component
MHRFIQGLKLVDPRDWGWIHFKAAIGILVPLLIFLSPPSSVASQRLAPGLVRVLVLLIFVGAILSIIGMLLRGTQTQPMIVGYSIEIVGLIFLFTGPFLLCIGYTYNAWQQGTTYTGAGLCYAIAAALLARFIDVYFHTLEGKKPGDPLISRE